MKCLVRAVVATLRLSLLASMALLVLPALAAQQEMPTVYMGTQDALGLGNRVEYLEDPSDSLSLEAVMASDTAAWQTNKSDTPNFGYSDSAYWFRVRLVNAELRALDALLAIHYPLLDHIELYMFEQGQLIFDAVTGDTYPFAQRPLRHRDFLFPITLHWDVPVDVYIKVRTEGSTQVPITLWNAKQFGLIDQDEQLIKALYYGMMLLLVVYNLFLFLSIRERPYLYYVGLASSLLALMAGAHGFMFQYVYPASPYLQKLVMLLAVPSTMLFASLFATFFLRLDRNAPRLYMLLSAISLLFLACIVGAFFLPYDTSTRISVFLAIPASLVIMFVGPYAWVKGQTSARYFTIAWFFLLSGIFVGAASKFGFLPRNAFTEYSISWGSALEAILLSFALADRFNRERIARYQAQRDRLQAIEQRKHVEQKLYHQATHQPVDGLPNMVLFQQRVHRLLHDEDSRQTQFTVIFIHLERLLEINKTLGHANADIILSLFSRRLPGMVHNPKMFIPVSEEEGQFQYFAHLEGVIYACLLQAVDASELKTQALRMHEALSVPVEFNSMKLDLGVSIGMASFPQHGRDIATLIRHARVAVDCADGHPEHIALYHDDINPYSARRLTLMGELNRAIQDDTLELYYQPIVRKDVRDVEAFEALLRWDHPSLGFIGPDEFISLAEKTGLMRSLTYWVLERCLKDSQSFADTPKLSINISVVNLQETDFVARVTELLQRYNFPPQRLICEITETAVMQDPAQSIMRLHELAALGIRIAIDDFGTGHSSLSYIRELPVYEVKVDRSFVMHMTQRENDQMIVRTAINLCHDLGYKVVGEGVEDDATLSMLEAFGCDYAQGYHIARPMRVRDVAVWQGAES